MKFKIFCFIAFFIITKKQIAQQISFRHYTSNDGLPSSCIYGVIQDSKNFLWIGTDKGISRFDGSEFKNYDINDGLATNPSLVFFSNNDTVFVGNLYGVSAIINHQKVTTLIKDSTNILGNNNIIKKGKYLYTITMYQSTTILDLSKKRFIYDPLYNNNTSPDDGVRYLNIDEYNTIYEARHSGFYKYINDTVKEKYTISGFSGIIDAFFFNKKNEMYFLANRKLYTAKNQKIIDSLALPTNSKANQTYISINSEDEIWCYNHDNDLIKVKKKNGKYEIVNYNQIFGSRNVSINSVKTDLNGNTWVATYNNGLYCIFNSFSTHYTDTDGLNGGFINDLFVDKEGFIYAGTHKGLFIKEPNKKFELDKHGAKYIYKIFDHKNTLYLCINNVQELFNKVDFANHHQTSYKRIHTIHARRALIYDSNMVYCQWTPEIFFYNLFTKKTIDIDYESKGARIQKIYTTNGKQYWIGTDFGLYFVDLPMKKSFKIKEVSAKVSDIIMSPKGVLFVATEKGLYQFRKKWVLMKENNGKLLSGINKIVIDKYKRIWAATNSGVLIGDIEKNLQHISGYPYLLSNDVNCMYYDSLENIMYLGTNVGVTLIDVKKFDQIKKNAPNVTILFASLNDSIYEMPSNLFFNLSNENLSIYFTAVEFNVPQNLLFRYKIDDGIWTITKERNLNLNSLERGYHRVEIQASIDRIHWGESSVFEFETPKKIYQTLGFQLFLILLTGGVIYFIMEYRVMRINAKNDEKLKVQQQLDDLRYQALNASINPHFIFNSLGSIQSYVTDNDPFNASDYIAKFAKLIRITINHADKKFISINEEINRLEIYLQLEKLRCGNKLIYDILVDEKLDRSILIPNMIIQPLIENSIIHGILSLPEFQVGFVKVEFFFNNHNQLEIVVTDNGKGIQNIIETYRSKEHKSIGLSNIRSRVMMIQDASFEIKNKKDFGINEPGARVVIILPIKSLPKQS